MPTGPVTSPKIEVTSLSALLRNSSRVERRCGGSGWDLAETQYEQAHPLVTEGKPGGQLQLFSILREKFPL